MGLKESGLRGSLRNVSVGIDAIPDSVVSRPDDTESVERDEELGFVVELKDGWPSIGAEISSLTSGQTTAYLREEDGTLIESQDISSLEAGDAFTFDDVNLTDGEKYQITLDADGSDYTQGKITDRGYPYTSDDIDIISRAINGESDENDESCINNIGNVGF